MLKALRECTEKLEALRECAKIFESAVRMYAHSESAARAFLLDAGHARKTAAIVNFAARALADIPLGMREVTNNYRCQAR